MCAFAFLGRAVHLLWAPWSGCGVSYDSCGHLAAPRGTRLHFSCTTMNPYRHKVATSFRRLFDCACRFRASGFLGCTNVLFDDNSLAGTHVAFIGMCGAVLH